MHLKTWYWAGVQQSWACPLALHKLLVCNHEQFVKTPHLPCLHKMQYGQMCKISLLTLVENLGMWRDEWYLCPAGVS